MASAKKLERNLGQSISASLATLSQQKVFDRKLKFKKEWQELLDTSKDLSARQKSLDEQLLKVKSGLEENEFIVVKRHVMEQLTESKSLYTHFATDLLLFKEKIPMFLLFILLSMVGILYSNVVFKAAVGGLGFLWTETRVLFGIVGLDTLLKRIPETYVKAIFGSYLASRFVYKYGVESSQFAFFEFIQVYLEKIQ